MNQKTELRACPFCGGSNVDLLRGTISAYILLPFVVCSDCGVQTYFFNEREIKSAIAAWNARAQPAVPDTHVLVPKDELKSLLFDYKFALVEWAEYASDYFKKKHGFEECVISLNDRAIKVLYGDAAQKEQEHG